MLEMSRHQYFGEAIPEELYSPFGRSSALANAKPSTGEVVSSYIEETFQGEGSLMQDLRARDIKKAEESGTPISEEDWKNSDSYRSGISYYPTMTKDSASILAEIQDDRTNREFIINKASGLQSAVGFASGFLTGIAEPKNLVSGVAAAITTSGLGAVFPSLGRMIAVNSIRGAAARGAAEGVVAAAVTEPSNLESSRIVQGDYDMSDSMINFALSSILGAGIGAGAKTLELRKVRKFQPDPQIATKEFDTALGQIVQGKKVDVQAVKDIENVSAVNKAIKDLPKIEEKIVSKQNETKLVPITERPEFKKWFEGSRVVDEQGQPKTVYHGSAREIQQFDIKKLGDVTGTSAAREGIFFIDNPSQAQGFADFAAKKINKESGQVTPVFLNIKNPKIVMQEGDFFKGGTKAIAREIKEAKSSGYDGVIFNKLVDDPTGKGLPATHYVVFKPEQIKSIFNRGAFDPNDPRLIDINEAENLVVKKGRIEQNAKTEIDQSKIKTFQESLSRPDNSTAYDLQDTQDISKYLDEWGGKDDIAALEQELTFLDEEIAELRNQELLSKDEMDLLSRLDEISAEDEIMDTVLANAKLCLTRG